MWNKAFKYTDSKTEAYTMWFFDDKNPNDQITKNIKAKDANAHSKKTDD